MLIVFFRWADATATGELQRLLACSVVHRGAWFKLTVRLHAPVALLDRIATSVEKGCVWCRTEPVCHLKFAGFQCSTLGCRRDGWLCDANCQKL